MTETVDLLAAIFRRLRCWRASHLQDAHRWREAAARSFADVAMALEAGSPPDEVATVCFAAAEGFSDPERAHDVRERCTRKLEATREPKATVEVVISIHQDGTYMGSVNGPTRRTSIPRRRRRRTWIRELERIVSHELDRATDLIETERGKAEGS